MINRVMVYSLKKMAGFSLLEIIKFCQLVVKLALAMWFSFKFLSSLVSCFACGLVLIYKELPNDPKRR